jgi:hypothetical protein
VFNPTYSVGDQRRAHNIGDLADCGQYASGVRSGPYYVGSIDPQTGARQPLAQRSPRDFIANHGRLSFFFAGTPVPAGAQGLAYYDRTTGGFHYARIERDAAGTMTGISQTDANAYGALNNGSGTFTMARADNLANILMVRGVQNVRRMQTVQQFVAYCQQNYNNAPYLFFFCYFR